MGKTTTAVNLAACVAEAGYPTLLVDLDPQCNATVALGCRKNSEPNVYDCLSGDISLDDAARADLGRAPRRSSPSTPDLAGANVELPRLPGSETRLASAIGRVSASATSSPCSTARRRSGRSRSTRSSRPTR